MTGRPSWLPIRSRLPQRLRTTLRGYPVDSPQAAARIVGLALLADGGVSVQELQALAHGHALAELGLPAAELAPLLVVLCEDLQRAVGAHRHGQGQEPELPDDGTLQRLLAEVESPALRQRVLDLCVRVAEADARVSHGESRLLNQAVAQWGLAPRMFVAPGAGPC